jgi:hypothetical protein
MRWRNSVEHAWPAWQPVTKLAWQDKGRRRRSRRSSSRLKRALQRVTDKLRKKSDGGRSRAGGPGFEKRQGRVFAGVHGRERGRTGRQAGQIDDAR